MPTDDELIAFLRMRPSSRLSTICFQFKIPWALPPNGTTYGYTPEAKALRTQLQRLRRAGVLRSGNGQTWEVK